MILGIDASTPGSGGGKRHLVELIEHFNIDEHKFTKIRIWGVGTLLDILPDKPWLEKRTHPFLNKGFLYRSFWQLFLRDKSFKNEIDVLFCPFGTYIGGFKPYVPMCRNMMVFDDTIKKYFGFSIIGLKLKLLFKTQSKSFSQSSGMIFLSKYAKESVLRQVHFRHDNISIIHHGVSDAFRMEPKPQKDIHTYALSNPFKLLYVSTIWSYKYPANVVKAVSILRQKGYPVSLDLVGNLEEKKTGIELYKLISEVDPSNDFIQWHQKIGLSEVAESYANADLFIYASSCENMPNILLEAMSSALPIACSDFEPMPEFLEDGGVYFNPTNVQSIVESVEQLLQSKNLRAELAAKAFTYSKQYSWKKCADETFGFLNSFQNSNLNS